MLLRISTIAMVGFLLTSCQQSVIEVTNSGCNQNTPSQVRSITPLACIIDERNLPDYVDYTIPKPGEIIQADVFKYDSGNAIIHVAIRPRTIINCPVNEELLIKSIELSIDDNSIPNDRIRIASGIVLGYLTDEFGKECEFDAGPYYYEWYMPLAAGNHRARIELSTNKYNDLVFEWCFEITE